MKNPEIGAKVKIAADGGDDTSFWTGVIVDGPDEAGNWYVRWDDEHKDSWEMLDADCIAD